MKSHERIVLHLDMDAFFASVEERDKPYLAGSPIVVGADPAGGTGRGIVATANYPARRYGIHSAMPIGEAWRRSERARASGEPCVVFITPRGHTYGEASQRVFQILQRFASTIEQVSVDEAYAEVSSATDWKRVGAFARRIQRAIAREEKLSASIGIGPNKLIAKIASDFKKPNGITVVPPDAVEAFLAPLPIEKIPGIGEKTARSLRQFGIKYIRDALDIPRAHLEGQFGKWGGSMFERLHGIDTRPVSAEHVEPKSVGAHDTFMTDTLDLKVLLSHLSALAGEVWHRLVRDGFIGARTLVLTVRFANFDTTTRSLTLSRLINSEHDLESHALKLFLPFTDTRENPRRYLIRMLGVRVEKLSKEYDWKQGVLVEG